MNLEVQEGPNSERAGLLGGGYYFMEMKFTCGQFCCYACGGTEWIEISEATDSSFQSTRPAARIKHTHTCDACRSDPYRSSLLLGGREVARAERAPVCMAPVCANDEVRLTDSKGERMGKLLTQGCWSIVCSIQGADKRPQFKVESLFCRNGYWYQLFKIYDQRDNEVGSLKLQ